MLLDIAMSLGGLISEPNGEAGQGRVEMPEDQQSPHPDPALNALDIMVGAWDLKGRDFVTNEKISGQSTFEWIEGRFFLVHSFNFDYTGRRIAGVEYIGYDEKSGHLKMHVFSTQNPNPLEYTWEVSENHYKGKFSDGNTLIGQWEWPGGGYEAAMTRIR